MRIVDLYKPEKGSLGCPYGGCVFFNPVPSDGEVAICVTCLPCITGDINGATDGATLRIELI